MGFIQNIQLNYAALEVIHRIMVEMDKNDIPIIIYFDLSKAFDS